MNSSRPAGRNPPTQRCYPPSAEQQALLALFRQIRFGRIHRLPVRGGQPVVVGLTWTQMVKVLGDNGPHPSAGSGMLRQEVSAFFAQLEEIGDGEITDLQVFDGLPRTYEVHGSLPG
jgi:hypothetical protein